MKPKITVGIPTYSRLPYLKEAINAALAQTYSNIEILLSQNPHPDPSICNEIAEYCRGLKDARIRYHLQPYNLGQTPNYNWLADHAAGDYVFLIGDDDRLLPRGVEILASAIEPGLAVISARRLVIDDKGNRLARFTVPARPDASWFPGWPYAQYEVPPGRLADPELWAWRQAMGIESSLVSTQVFRRLRYRENLDMPDVLFFILLARARAEFLFIPEYVNEYRFHPASSTSIGFVNFKGLFDELAPLPVSAAIEPYKYRLLGTLAFKAVSRCLLAGEIEEARRLIASEYYPVAHTRLKGFIFKAAAALPRTIGTRAFRACYAARFGR